MGRESNSVEPSRHFLSAIAWLSLTVLVAIVVIGTARGAGYVVAFDTGSTAKAVAIFAGIGSFALICTQIAPRCVAPVASFFVLMLAGIAAGTLSMVGQMFGFPLIDGQLAAADQWLGVTAADVVGLTVAIPGAPRALAIVYVLSPILILISAFALGIIGRTERAWELCAAFCFCLLVATVVSFLFPAVGAFEHSGLAARYGDQLPGGSGVYHLESFHSLRGSTKVVIDPFRLEGLVTFPSFHTAMALMTAAAWRDDPWLRWPMIAWNTLVVVSTVPIGGHYLVDLIGGAVSWFAIYRYGPAWAEAIMSPAIPPLLEAEPA